MLANITSKNSDGPDLFGDIKGIYRMPINGLDKNGFVELFVENVHIVHTHKPTNGVAHNIEEILGKFATEVNHPTKKYVLFVKEQSVSQLYYEIHQVLNEMDELARLLKI